MTVQRGVATNSDILLSGLSLRRMSVQRSTDTGSDVLASGVSLRRQSVQRGAGPGDDILLRGVSAGYAKELLGAQMDPLKDMSTTITRTF